jgi:hypothetical protein
MPGIADLTARTGGRADIAARLRAALAADIGPMPAACPALRMSRTFQRKPPR